jgi:hypothetical protein
VVRHQPEIQNDAPCCPLASSRRAVLRGLPEESGHQRRVGSLYVVCSVDDATVADSSAAFEDWLARTFVDAHVLERRRPGGPHAIEWMRHDCESRSRLDGWVSPDRTTVYLFGDPDLARETAAAVRGLLSPDCVVVNGAWAGTLPDARPWDTHSDRRD